MNHAREIIENTIAVKSKNKVLRIIRNEIMHKPEATEKEIFKFLKHNPTEQWLKVLDRLTKKDIFIPPSNPFDFFDVKTVKYMINRKFLDKSYIVNIRHCKRHASLNKNAELLYNAFEKEGYYNMNHENGADYMKSCIQNYQIDSLIDGLDNYKPAIYEMEKNIKNDFELWNYLYKWDYLTSIASKEGDEKSVAERLIDLKKFKFADEETVEFLFAPERCILDDLSEENKVKVFEQIPQRAKDLAVELNEDFNSIYQKIKANKERKKILKHVNTLKNEEVINKKRL